MYGCGCNQHELGIATFSLCSHWSPSDILYSPSRAAYSHGNATSDYLHPHLREMMVGVRRNKDYIEKSLTVSGKVSGRGLFGKCQETRADVQYCNSTKLVSQPEQPLKLQCLSTVRFTWYATTVGLLSRATLRFFGLKSC